LPLRKGNEIFVLDKLFHVKQFLSAIEMQRKRLIFDGYSDYGINKEALVFSSGLLWNWGL